MAVVALVPMKGHSERVPNKNLRPIAGKPLFQWILEALLGAASVGRVVVDTDSDAIAAAVASSFGDIEIHMRPDHLHGDYVPMHDIVAYLVSTVAGDNFLQTHATNPLLSSGTIDAAVEAFSAPGDHDSLMSVTPRHSRFYLGNGAPVNHDPEVLTRTQDLEPLYEENSNIYIASRAVIERTGRRVGPNPLLFSMSPIESVDIDDEHDFGIAEFLLRKRDG